ncbi:GRAM domain-containing protein [Paenibacillus sp. KN14-4R]|uniref:GRAM domain-containing protein n=1 Tax=Paenibacillus sp. KN14-4R TaxID=3445773 RepID=UPI003FA16D93
MFELKDDETLLISYQVYYYINPKEQVIGDLRLTNQRTIFESKKINLQQEYIEFLNSDILKVEKFNQTMSKGLKITLNKEQEYKFKMIDREKIIEIYINAKVNVV